jgi:hypothetical protein
MTKCESRSSSDDAAGAQASARKATAADVGTAREVAEDPVAPLASNPRHRVTEMGLVVHHEILRSYGPEMPDAFRGEPIAVGDAGAKGPTAAGMTKPKAPATILPLSPLTAGPS